MDGSTAVGVRARLVDDFNANARVFVFLLTTKVGGLGINLTGADRCVRSRATDLGVGFVSVLTIDVRSTLSRHPSLAPSGACALNLRFLGVLFCFPADNHVWVPGI